MPTTHSNSVSPSKASPAKAPAKIEEDREFKAHIYQHLVDLQPFLAPDSQVAVLVQQESDEDSLGGTEDEVSLTLVATLGDYRLEAEGRDADMYEAFGIAKRRMVEQLEEYYSTAVDSNERDAEIASMVDGRNTLH